MKRSCGLLLGCAALLLVVRPGPPRTLLGQAPGTPLNQDKEEAARANNLGVARLEQFAYPAAVQAFRRALQLDPTFHTFRLNLAIALYHSSDFDWAWREASTALEGMASAPQPHYVLGVISRALNRPNDAIASFRRVRDIDSRDVGTNVNLGQLYLQQRLHTEAIAAFRTAVDEEPFNVTAVYNLGVALVRAGRRDEGQRLIERSQALRLTGYGTLLTSTYLEQGRYAEAVSTTGAEAELVDRRTPEVRLAPAAAPLVASNASASGSAGAFGGRFKVADLAGGGWAALVGSLASRVALLDFDGDGDPDLVLTGSRGLRLFRNDAGKLAEATVDARLSLGKSAGVVLGALAGDYDNDGRPDLFVLRYGGNLLFHNDGNGRFRDVTSAAGLPAYSHLAISAAWLDVDHDGDLDLFIAGLADVARALEGDRDRLLTFPDDFPGAPHLLLRNNGNGAFSDVTAAAGLAGPRGRAVAVAPTDYDNRRDIDVMVVHYGAAPALFQNRRDGAFTDVAAKVGLSSSGRFTTAAAADINKDGFTDFFFGRADAVGLFAVSDGRGRFVLEPGPPGSDAVTAGQFFDYDNDGLLDLMALSNTRARLYRNVGKAWIDVTGTALSGAFTAFTALTSGSDPPAGGGLERRGLATADLDEDGDTDAIVASRGDEARLWRNEGGSRNRSLRVQLTSRFSNRGAIGAKLEMRAGSLRQKLESSATIPPLAPADAIFGLGRRRGADVVRALWPSGILQAETVSGTSGPPGFPSLRITELNRKPSSCPYLFTWSGERFEFVTDFLGGGEMGYWLAPGVWNDPDPDEYVRIRPDQLQPREGRLEIRVTNELEETLFLDALKLIEVTHPSEVEVFPNEGMVGPPRPPFRVHAVKDRRQPARVVDDDGCDLRSSLAGVDRLYADHFRLHRLRGYAEPHTLTIDLGPPDARGAGEPALLLLTGWTDYAFSSDNVAAHQSGLGLTPPALQVRDEKNQWRTVIADIGVPVGRPQTIVVDLSETVLGSRREARILTNMRVYWDQVLVGRPGDPGRIRMTPREPIAASLAWRGFSEAIAPDGREPFAYDYHRVLLTSPWKVMTGHYTREGDVRALLRRADDMFVVARPGDEVAVSFDAAGSPAPPGWTRTYLLYSDGFSKEMDIRSASPDRVAPLPFHAMRRYPYSPPEAYPRTPAHLDYVERYNTRLVQRSVPSLDTLVEPAPRK